MLKETIQFTDFNDNAAVTVEYFNLTKNEIIDLEGSIEGGLSAELRKVQDNPTAKGLLDLLKIIAHASYGIKSQDGKFFEKSPEITNRFIHSAFYDDFLFSLLENDATKGLAFIRGVIPAQLLEAAEKQIAGKQYAGVDSTPVYEPSARERFAAAQAESAAIVPQPAITIQENSAPAPQHFPGPRNAEEWAQYQAWQDQKNAAQATQASSAPASPDSFRVREEEPLQGFPQ